MTDVQYLIAGVIIVVVVGLLEWNNTKVVAYNLMLRAKDLAKDKILSGGKEQEDWVVAKLKEVLPKRLTLFLGDEVLRTLVKFLYNKGLDYLDDGKFNNSVK